MDSAEVESSRAARPLRHSLLIFAVIGFLVFGHSLWNEYTYDGEWLIARVAGLKSTSEYGAGAPLNPVPLGLLLSPSGYGDATGVQSWRPLTELTFMLLDVRLFRLNAALSHTVNVLLHIANGWLLFLLLDALDGERKRRVYTWLASLAFFLHPLVTEAVYCVGFRGDLLALFFVLLSLIFLVKARAKNRRIYTVLFVVFFLLGLLSKEIAVVELVAAPAMLLLFGRKESRRVAAANFAILAGVFAAFFLVWSSFKYAAYNTTFMGGGGRLLGMANFATAFCEIYVRKLLVPWPLRIDYAFEPETTLFNLRFGLWLSLLLLAGIGAIPLCRKSPRFLFGVLWVMASFAPVSQIVPVPDPVAERFCYVPLVGVAFMLAGLGEIAFVPRALLRVLLVCWGIVSFARGFDWRNDVTLNIATWEQPDDRRPVALENLGALYMENARTSPHPDEELAKSLTYLNELTAAAPANAEGWRLLALNAMARGDMAAARAAAARAQELAPEDDSIVKLNQALAAER